MPITPEMVQGLGQMAQQLGQRGTRGPFGGDVAMKGAGGFQALPQATVARPTPPPAPAPARPPQRPMMQPQRPMMGASNPYGPVQVRPENSPNRIAARAAAVRQAMPALRQPLMRR